MTSPDIDKFAVPIKFSLKAQGHLPKIELMLAAGANWDEIASAIGWDRQTARLHYEAAIGDSSTRELRVSLAECLEVIWKLWQKYHHHMAGNDLNLMAQATFNEQLLESRKRT